MRRLGEETAGRRQLDDAFTGRQGAQGFSNLREREERENGKMMDQMGRVCLQKENYISNPLPSRIKTR